MTEEQSWLSEKMNQCATLIEDFSNIYESQLFNLCRQAISSEEPLPIREISCTKVNILLDLKRARLDLDRLRSLVFGIYNVYNNQSNDYNDETKKVLYDHRFIFSQQIEVYQLLNHLIQLTNLEYDKEYESTVYKKMVDCIFASIKKNSGSKSFHVLTDTKNFLNTLTEKEKGELIVEHFTINYSKNQDVFFSSLSSGLENYGAESSIFGNVIQSLGEEFRSLNLEDKIKKLGSIYQTDFYQKHFSNQTFGTK